MPMNSKLKRIIAREGLVILGCLIFIGILFLITKIIPYEKPAYCYIVSTGGHKYKVDTTSYLNINDSDLSAPAWFADELEIFRDIKKGHPDDFKDPVYSKASDAIIDKWSKYEVKAQDPVYSKVPNAISIDFIPDDLKFKYKATRKPTV